MNWRQLFSHGGTASLLSIVACILYYRIYTRIFETDFTAILNVKGIVIASVLGCMLISLGYTLLNRWGKQKWRGLFNVLVVVLSFASAISPLAITLPLDLENPELFPGLAIPMHLIPALVFFTILPFFESKGTCD